MGMTNAAHTLTGHDAIEMAERLGLGLSKYADPVEDARTGLTPDEAREVAAEDPGLIYLADIPPHLVGARLGRDIAATVAESTSLGELAEIDYAELGASELSSEDGDMLRAAGIEPDTREWDAAVAAACEAYGDAVRERLLAAAEAATWRYEHCPTMRDERAVGCDLVAPDGSVLAAGLWSDGELDTESDGCFRGSFEGDDIDWPLEDEAMQAVWGDA